MKEIVIYGHSDDCIEVDGAFRDEGYVGNDDTGFVLVTTGVESTLRQDVFAVAYTEAGVWRVSHKVDSGRLTVRTAPGPDKGTDDSYTDMCTVGGPIRRVDVVKEWPPSMRSMRAELRAFDLRDHVSSLSDEDVRRVTEILTGLTIPADVVTP